MAVIRSVRWNVVGAAMAAFFVLASCDQQPQKNPQEDVLNKIGHIVVIYEENRSFDSYFGLFPGANGIANAGAAATQVNKAGEPFPKLPPILNSNDHYAVDARFPADLPNAPFQITLGKDEMTGDMVHKFYEEQLQINGGKMNRFADVSDAGGLVMGYWDTSDTTEYKLAKDYVLGDNFFHAAFGGSFLNHVFLACACVFQWPVLPPPEELQPVKDANGDLIKGTVTSDGYVVNTVRSVQLPKPGDDVTKLLPPQTMPHIGDLLDKKGITWKWYAGGFNDALAGHPGPLFQHHHQPFMYFANMVKGSDNQKARLQDHADLMKDIADNTLPQVVFYKPIGEENLHPGYANISDGEDHLKVVMEALMASPAYKDMMIIITFDEHGGQWDHVAPPQRDKWGPGSRVPLIVVSPFAKRGYVDHTQYDTLSILKTIEDRFGLGSLNATDAAAVNLKNTLQ